MNPILPVRICCHIIGLPLLITLWVATAQLAADELDFVINGVDEPELSNVRSRVEPFRLARSSSFSKTYLENMRHESEQQTREALRPYGYYHATVDSEVRKSAQGGHFIP